MGLPIEHFVAATNVNDTVPRFLKKVYDPKPSKTISNAMDVGNPVILFKELYQNDLEQIFHPLPSLMKRL
jgi:threonine synthase